MKRMGILLNTCPGKSSHFLEKKNLFSREVIIKTSAASILICEQIILPQLFYLLKRDAILILSQHSQFHGNCNNERQQHQEPGGRHRSCFSLFTSGPRECQENRKMNCVSMSELHNTIYPHFSGLLKTLSSEKSPRIKAHLRSTVGLISLNYVNCNRKHVKVIHPLFCSWVILK